jgi:hypothetical protein
MDTNHESIESLWEESLKEKAEEIKLTPGDIASITGEDEGLKEEHEDVSNTVIIPPSSYEEKISKEAVNSIQGNLNPSAPEKKKRTK